MAPSLPLRRWPPTGLTRGILLLLRALVAALVRRTGATCVWATHDLQALPPQAERVVLLRERRLIFDGAVEEGLSRTWLVRAGLAVPQAG